MNEITSYPKTVRERLEEVQALARYESQTSAESATAKIGQELARSSPELAALVLAQHRGYPASAISKEEVKTTTRTTDLIFCGIRVGRDVQTTKQVVTERITLDGIAPPTSEVKGPQSSRCQTPGTGYVSYSAPCGTAGAKTFLVICQIAFVIAIGFYVYVGYLMWERDQRKPSVRQSSAREVHSTSNRPVHQSRYRSLR